MRIDKKAGALTEDEKRVVKRLLLNGWRSQDIHALINVGRNATVNSGRIAEVKADASQAIAGDEELEFFKIKKRSFNPKTGLNLYDDERLIRAREAMILAVQIFNSPTFCFKSEVFSILTNVAWTYLLHEHYLRKGVKIEKKDGWTLALSEMIERPDCPVTEGTKNNLRALKLIRDQVVHKMLGRADRKWFLLFQACCLNFDRVLCELFGDKLSLSQELSFSLQFCRMSIDQLAVVNRYEIPPHINALDANIEKGMTEEQLNDLDFQFRVAYTLVSASKGKAHFEFLRPDTAEGREIRNVLVNFKPADDMYPYKAHVVCRLVKEQTASQFTSYNHVQAWHKFKVRPRVGSKKPENTNKDFCIYHSAHGDYTYSQKWVDFLIGEVNDPMKYSAIRAVKIR